MVDNSKQIDFGDSTLIVGSIRTGATGVGQQGSRLVQRTTITSDATAGARTYTAAEVIGGIIVRDPNGASRSDVWPTAALLVAGLKSATGDAQVGDTIRTIVINGADAAEVLTIGAGTGGGFDTNQTAAARVLGQNISKNVHTRITNVTASSEAYVIYA